MLSTEILSQYPQLQNLDISPDSEALITELITDMHTIRDTVIFFVDDLGIKLPDPGKKITFMEQSKLQGKIMMGIPKVLKKLMPDEDADPNTRIDFTKLMAMVDKYKPKTQPAA